MLRTTTSLYKLGSSTITPSRTARNLGVVIDDQLSFTDHIATTARSCRFALYNIRKIRPFLSEQAAQLLVQALVLSRLDYCNALLAGLPACTIMPLQLIQNAAARVVFNEMKKAHVTPLFIRLHWHCTNIPKLASSNLCALQKLAFCRWTTPCGAIPKRYQITLTDLFLDCAQLVEWPPDLTAESLAIFKKHLKTHHFRQHLTN